MSVVIIRRTNKVGISVLARVSALLQKIKKATNDRTEKKGPRWWFTRVPPPPYTRTILTTPWACITLLFVEGGNGGWKNKIGRGRSSNEPEYELYATFEISDTRTYADTENSVMCAVFVNLFSSSDRFHIGV